MDTWEVWEIETHEGKEIEQNSKNFVLTSQDSCERRRVFSSTSTTELNVLEQEISLSAEDEEESFPSPFFAGRTKTSLQKTNCERSILRMNYSSSYHDDSIGFTKCSATDLTKKEKHHVLVKDGEVMDDLQKCPKSSLTTDTFDNNYGKVNSSSVQRRLTLSAECQRTNIQNTECINNFHKETQEEGNNQEEGDNSVTCVTCGREYNGLPGEEQNRTSHAERINIIDTCKCADYDGNRQPSNPGVDEYDGRGDLHSDNLANQAKCYEDERIENSCTIRSTFEEEGEVKKEKRQDNNMTNITKHCTHYVVDRQDEKSDDNEACIKNVASIYDNNNISSGQTNGLAQSATREKKNKSLFAKAKRFLKSPLRATSSAKLSKVEKYEGRRVGVVGGTHCVIEEERALCLAYGTGDITARRTVLAGPETGENLSGERIGEKIGESSCKETSDTEVKFPCNNKSPIVSTPPIMAARNDNEDEYDIIDIVRHHTISDSVENNRKYENVDRSINYDIAFKPENSWETSDDGSSQLGCLQKGLMSLVVGVGLGEERETNHVVSNVVQPHSVEEHGRFVLGSRTERNSIPRNTEVATSDENMKAKSNDNSLNVREIAEDGHIRKYSLEGVSGVDIFVMSTPMKPEEEQYEEQHPVTNCHSNENEPLHAVLHNPDQKTVKNTKHIRKLHFNDQVVCENEESGVYTGSDTDTPCISPPNTTSGDCSEDYDVTVTSDESCTSSDVEISVRHLEQDGETEEVNIHGLEMNQVEKMLTRKLSDDADSLASFEYHEREFIDLSISPICPRSPASTHSPAIVKRPVVDVEVVDYVEWFMGGVASDEVISERIMTADLLKYMPAIEEDESKGESQSEEDDEDEPAISLQSEFQEVSHENDNRISLKEKEGIGGKNVEPSYRKEQDTPPSSITEKLWVHEPKEMDEYVNLVVHEDTLHQVEEGVVTGETIEFDPVYTYHEDPCICLKHAEQAEAKLEGNSCKTLHTIPTLVVTQVSVESTESESSAEHTDFLAKVNRTDSDKEEKDEKEEGGEEEEGDSGTELRHDDFLTNEDYHDWVERIKPLLHDAQVVANLYVRLANKHAKHTAHDRSTQHLQHLHSAQIAYDVIKESNLTNFASVITHLLSYLGVIKSENPIPEKISVPNLLSLLEDLIKSNAMTSHHVTMFTCFMVRPNRKLNEHHSSRVHFLHTCFEHEVSQLNVNTEELRYLRFCFMKVSEYFVLLDTKLAKTLTNEYILPHISYTNSTSFIMDVLSYMGLVKSEAPVITTDDITSSLILLQFIFLEKNISLLTSQKLYAFIQLDNPKFRFCTSERQSLVTTLRRAIDF